MNKPLSSEKKSTSAEDVLHLATDFICETQPESHSPEALFIAKRAFADTAACLLYGSDSSVAQTALRAAQAMGGTGEVPLYGAFAGEKLPMLFAALVNGACSHAYDLDDWTDIANDHPSAVLVPALLAASAAMPTCHGRDLLHAYLVGLDVIFKIGATINMEHYNLGWHTTVTIGSYGAAAALCCLWKLSKEQTQHALCLVSSLAVGSVSQFGTMSKPLHAGFAAKNGIMAASFARAGATAAIGAFAGDVSFASLMMPEGKRADFLPAFSQFGKNWGALQHGVHIKYYPSCGYIHRAIDGILALRAKHQPAMEDIAKIHISLPDFHLAILPFHQPQDKIQALFSPAYCAAIALLRGSCSVDDFGDDALFDPTVQSLIARTEIIGRTPKNPKLNYDKNDPDIVEIRYHDGTILREEIVLATGMKGKDVSEAQMVEKFNRCVRDVMGSEQSEALYQLLQDLDNLEDVQILHQHLTGSR